MNHEAINVLNDLPRAGLGHWPTPFHFAPRFSADLGVDVWLKRDDVQGVALAGNKLRKFDLVLGDALAQGKNLLVTTGALQSNSARIGAASAAAVGMRAVLLLSGEKPDTASANVLIDQLVGAEVRFAGDVSWDYLNAGVNDIVSEFHRKEYKPFAAPVGCSSPMGALGFARGFLELQDQMDAAGVKPSAIVHTSTSGGTHAGLLVGRALAGSNVRIIGIDVGAIHAQPENALLELANLSAQRLDFQLEVNAADVEITTDQLGAGYAIPSDEGNAAIDLLARNEAILVDPIYSGKGLAGFIDLVRSGSLDGPVVFWHTGGYHALFA